MTKEEEKKYCIEICNLLQAVIAYFNQNGFVALDKDIYNRLIDSKDKLKTFKYIDTKKLELEVSMHMIDYQYDLSREIYYRDDPKLPLGIMFLQTRLPMVYDEIERS